MNIDISTEDTDFDLEVRRGFLTLWKTEKGLKGVIASEPPGVFVASPQKPPMLVHNAHYGKTGLD